MESNTNEFYMKKIVITGASSGIGSCCANYFLNCGAQVALVGRDVEGMKSIAKQYSKNATIIKCDLTQEIQIKDLKTSIIEIFGSIDILINCAGLKLDSDIEKTFPQDFDYSININLKSVFLLVNNFSKFFSPNGCIVNVSCLYGTRPMQGLISFCMGKAGLEAFTKSAAGEFASEGIRVNCVSCCPLFSNSLRYVQTHEGENTLMEDTIQHINQCNYLETFDSLDQAVISYNRTNVESLTHPEKKPSIKWQASVFRYVADLKELWCPDGDCEERRIYSLERVIQEIKEGVWGKW